jgi:hypothetical protein
LLRGGPEGEVEVFVSPDFGAWFLQVIFRDSSQPPVLLDIGDDDPDYPPTVQEEVPPPQVVICLFILSVFICILFSVNFS